MRTFLSCLLLLLYSCTKTSDLLPAPFTPASGDTTGFIKYIIPSGAHYTTHNKYTPVEAEELKFTVRFDSSAIYQSRSASNQYDINKLYGFSDNGSGHHQFSARFGWRWSDGALRLFAYVYNEGKVISEELGTARIGTEIRCRIKITSESYLFYWNEKVTALPRKSTTATGKGYLLYPYFGGNETAPHEIAIWICPLSP